MPRLSWELASPRRKTGACHFPSPKLGSTGVTYGPVGPNYEREGGSELDGSGRPVEAGAKRSEHHQITLADAAMLHPFPQREGDGG